VLLLAVLASYSWIASKDMDQRLHSEGQPTGPRRVFHESAEIGGATATTFFDA
jgi:hypothetical protein